MISNSNDEVNFRHKLLITGIQVSSLCKAFANKLLSNNVHLSKTRLSKKNNQLEFLTDFLDHY